MFKSFVYISILKDVTQVTWEDKIQQRRAIEIPFKVNCIRREGFISATNVLKGVHHTW